MDTALVKDLENILRTADLFAWIETQAQKLSELGWSDEVGLSFSAPLLQARRIVDLQRLYETHRRYSGDAYLETVSGGYRISYVRSRNPARQRFAIAHEIGHTYWLRPGPEMKSLSPLQARMRKDATIETLCDRFAACLLFPSRKVKSVLNDKSDHSSLVLEAIASVPGLAKRFRVTEQLVARRLLTEAKSLQLMVVALSFRMEQWRVAWSLLPDHAKGAEAVEGLAIPLRSSPRRVIPGDWIPDIPDDGTRVLDLDARWWNISKPTREEETRRRFSGLEPIGVREGFAFRQGERLILAFESA